MSDRHPRPWRVNEIGWIIDAEDDIVAYDLGDDNDRPTAELIVAAVNGHSPWIGVGERMPEVEAKYIVHCPSADPDSPLIAMAWYHPSERAWSLIPEYWASAISHWMPFPCPPSA